MIVYIVTEGEYSGYGIEGVFSTQEKAQAFIDEKSKAVNYRTPNIKEYVIDEQSEGKTVPVWSAYCEIEDGDARPYVYSGNLQYVIASRMPVTHITHGKDGRPVTVIVSSQVSQEHAIKCAVEKRQAILREAVETTAPAES